MQLAVRSSLASGVAILGAGVLVVAPVNPVLPDLPDPVSAVRSAVVELSAAANPLVVAPSIPDVANIASLPVIAQLATLPSPSAVLAVATAFLEQFEVALAAVPDQLRQVVEYLQAGQITSALDTAATIPISLVTGPILDAIFTGTGPLVELVDILQPALAFAPPLANVVGLLKNPDFLLTIGLGPLQSIYTLTSGLGGTAEAVLGDIEAGDPAAAVTSLIKGLGELTDAVVKQVFYEGTAPYYTDRGLIASIFAAGQMIVDALTAPAAASSLTAVTVDATAAESADAVDIAAPAAPPATDNEGAVAAEPVAQAAAPVAAQPVAQPEAAVAAESASVEPAAAEEVTAVSVAVKKPTSTPEVRTGIVAVPGEVTVGVAKDEDDTPTKAGAAEDSETSEPNESTAGTADGSGSAPGSGAGSRTESTSGSDSDSNSNSNSNGGSGSDD